MTDRALSFGSAAAAYERYRPGYPGDVAERILAYASGSVATALEIGAGTGKATRLLVDRGIAVTATEPDQRMLDELRRRVPPVARTLRATFEQVPLDRTHDLLLAAASLHWTREDGRWARAAALLRPGGTFASFGGPMWLADRDLEAAVLGARNAVLGSDDVPGDFLGASRSGAGSCASTSAPTGERASCCRSQCCSGGRRARRPPLSKRAVSERLAR